MLSLFCRDLLIGLSGTKQNDERSNTQTEEFSGKEVAAATVLDSLCPMQAFYMMLRYAESSSLIL